jgi:hypothetical protein
MYATMMPRLQAEQHLEQHRALVAAGELMMEERPRAQYIDGLQRQANGGKRVQRPTQGGLEAMGIAVKIEPPSEKKGGD